MVWLMVKTIGLIRVITLKNRDLIEAHGKIIEKHFPGLRVISKCIDDQPYGIYDDESERKAIPKIIEVGKELIRMNVDALIVSCAADPGVRELREIVHVPVIGAGSASACLALGISNRIGVLTLTGETPRVIREILGNNLVAEASPQGVKTTLDLMRKENEKYIFEAAIQLKREKCNIILLACTGFSTIGISSKIHKLTGIPVVDPVTAAGLFAWYSTLKGGF